jgi:hypothetical protein
MYLSIKWNENPYENGSNDANMGRTNHFIDDLRISPTSEVSIVPEITTAWVEIKINIYNFLKRYTPVTYSRNTPTEEPRMNSGIVRSYPYWSVALRIVTVIIRSSPCISVAILDNFWTCTKNCYGKINRSVSLLVRIKPYLYVLVRTSPYWFVVHQLVKDFHGLVRRTTYWYGYPTYKLRF